jgi:hypothetical protein
MRILHQKVPQFVSLFTLLDELENLEVTSSRVDFLAQKRHDKRLDRLALVRAEDVVFVGPLAPAQTAEERRISSISTPTVSSSGTVRFRGALEQESEKFANLFCTILSYLYLDNVKLEWARGRKHPLILAWRQRYLRIFSLTLVL